MEEDRRGSGFAGAGPSQVMGGHQPLGSGLSLVKKHVSPEPLHVLIFSSSGVHLGSIIVENRRRDSDNSGRIDLLSRGPGQPTRGLGPVARLYAVHDNSPSYLRSFPYSL